MKRTYDELMNSLGMTVEPNPNPNRKKLAVKTLAELDDLLNSLQHEEGISYSLDVTVPLSQEALVKLSVSPLGMNLEQVTIYPEYEDGDPPVIDTSQVTFPMLKKFSAECQAFQSVHFTADCFPLLESLSIESPCATTLDAFHTELPNLQHMNFQYVTIEDTSDFGPSLSRSPKLETFTSYKLWGLGSKSAHRLILPNMKNLDLYRSDDLRGLKLWAPRLEDLNLQACYDISKVDLLKQKPAGFSGPEYAFAGEESEFELNCINCCDIPPKGTMVTSPRCKKVHSKLCDDDNPTFFF